VDSAGGIASQPTIASGNSEVAWKIARERWPIGVCRNLEARFAVLSRILISWNNLTL